MADNKINVGGRLHSISTGNILTGADEIFDDSKNKKQNDINTETYILVNEVNEKLATLSPEQQSALAVATKANKNEANLGYYVCETEANVAAKVIADATGYILAAGGSIKIKMNNTNTASNATLNINSTGVKPLYYDGERASATNTWEAGEIVEVYYDGTNFYANNVAGGGTFASGEKVKNVGIDSEPTAGSESLVKSGGISNELALGAVYDVSAKNPTAGPNNNGKFESLSALLSDANLSTLIPTFVRKGGMSIKFVLSSGNKYVQYFLTKNQWSASEADWQKINLEEEVASMQNILPIIPDKSIKTFVGWYDAYSGRKTEKSYNNYHSTDRFSFAYYDYFVRDILNGLQGIASNTSFQIYFWKNNVYKGYEKYSFTLSSWQILNPSQQQVSSLEDLGDIDIFAITISTTYIPLSKLRSPIYQYFDDFDVVDPKVELALQYLKYGFEFEWLPGYRGYSSGNYDEHNLFRTTSTPFPKVLAPLLYKARIEDIGYSTTYVDSYYSLYKDGVYVGSYGRHFINDEIVICYWDKNQHVVDNIEYDSFYITFYKSQNPDYLNNIKVPPYLSMTEEQEWNRIEKAFYALGDSITQGAFADNVSYADWLNNEILFDSFTKLAISGCSCMKNATHPTLYLHKEVESLPSNADGIISVMIGVNDISGQNPLGSVAEAMALDYSQLDDETTFANAFRYNMEGIQRKCPNAILLCLLPIKTKVTTSYPYVSDENMNALRDIEKGICYALGIPFIETQLAGFSQYCNWSTFMNDSVHPIEAGHKKIAQFLKGKFLQYK